MVTKYYNTSPACNVKAELIILLKLQSPYACFLVHDSISCSHCHRRLEYDHRIFAANMVTTIFSYISCPVSSKLGPSVNSIVLYDSESGSEQTPKVGIRILHSHTFSLTVAT
jgi:hypothetical protein